MGRKILITLSVLDGLYLILAVGFGLTVGYLQPQREETVVLITTDSNGTKYERVLTPRQDESGQLWLVSGQWSRSWYRRALEYPEIELRRGSEVSAYRAMPGDDGDVARLRALYTKGMSPTEVFFGRAMFLFAPAKVLKLEPID